MVARIRILQVLAALILAASIAGCGGTSAAQGGKHTTSTSAPTKPTATTNPDATATAGPVCQGGLWHGIIDSAGPNIPLPPQTVSGLRENFPSDGTWTGLITRLCTSGNLEQVDGWEQQHMLDAGWNEGQPPSSCTSCAGLVWTHANDNRLVQFEPHPTLLNGTVQWSVIIYTH